MQFSALRALVFFLIGLPIGFIAVAFAFAVSQTAIAAGAILPWALAIAAGTGCVGGFQKPAGESQS
jgi:hypothetical protein